MVVGFLVVQVSPERTDLPNWPVRVIVQVSRICFAKPMILKLFMQYVFESEQKSLKVLYR